MAVKAIPDGYHTVTPYLIINGAAEAIEFYKSAFGATELVRMPDPQGQDRARGNQDRRLRHHAGGRASRRWDTAGRARSAARA